MKLKDIVIILLITAALSLIGNLVGQKTSILEALPGAIILVGISVLGIVLSKVIPGNIPSVAYIVIIGTILTIPSFPGSELINGYVEKVNFLTLATPVLGYAGVFTGKNLDTLKETGWRIVVTAFVVMLGTYLCSAIIANIILKMIKII